MSGFLTDDLDPSLDSALRGRLGAVAERHASPGPLDGARRAARTARGRSARRTAGATAGAAMLVAVPVVLLTVSMGERGTVIPSVGSGPTSGPSVPGPVLTSITPGTWYPFGIASDDVLEVRADPSASAAVVATVAPAGQVEVLGTQATVDGQRWWQVPDGWVPADDLALKGETSDVTSLVIERNDGNTPRGATSDELVRVIADAFAGPGQDVVTVQSSNADGVFVATIDIAGSADGVAGDRLVLRATEEFGVTWLRGVEATSMCSRSLGVDGSCA